MKVKALNIFFYVAIGFLSILISIFLYTTFKFPSIGPDSGFYLSIARDLANGSNYYTDLPSNYPPFGMWFYSLFFKYFDASSISTFFAINYVVYFINTFLFFKITLFFSSDLKARLLFSLLFLVVLFRLDGIHILLENFVLLFQLILSLVLFSNKETLSPLKLLLLGLLAFLAFYSKQYGLVVVPTVLLYLYNTNRTQFIKTSLFFVMGFLLPILVLIIWNIASFEIPIKTFILRLFGVSWKDGLAQTGSGYSIDGLIATLIVFFKLFPFLLLTVFVIPKFFKNKEVQYIMVLTICSSFSLYFAYYPHYFQLIIPFTLFLVLAVINTHVEYKYIFMAFFVFSIFGLSKYVQGVYDYKKSYYDQQLAFTEVFNSIVPENTKVLLYGPSPAYYYLCGFKSPNSKNLGYAFSNGLPIENFVKYMDDDAYVIAKLDYFKKFQKANLKIVKIKKLNPKLIYALYKKDGKK